MTTSSPGIFDNIYRKDSLGFRDDSEFDYAKIASFINLDKAEISKLAGVSRESVRFDHKIPREVRDRLDEIANICNLVAEHFEGDSQKTALWFKAPNPMLGNVTPRDMLRLGRYKKLIQFVIDAMNEAGWGEQESSAKTES